MRLGNTSRRRADFSYVGWNPVEIRVGSSLFRPGQASRLELGFRAGIRNCSYSPDRRWIGIAAEDRSDRADVLATYDLSDETSRVLLRQASVLQQDLDQAGSKFCFTQLPRASAGADLCVFDLRTEETRVVGPGIAAHGSGLAWLPDGRRIAFESSDGGIEILDTVDGRRDFVARGRSPAVTPRGETIAFWQQKQLCIWNHRDVRTQQRAMRRRHRRRSPGDGLSWAPDGTHLSFGLVAGLVGKRTRFYIVDIASGRSAKVPANYLSGLVLMERASEGTP